MEKTFAGKIALVTGGAQGIGKIIAEYLGQRGAQLAIGDIVEDMAKDTAKELGEELGMEARGYKMNVGSSESVNAVFAQIADELGAVDILINNAGITRDNLLVRMKDEEWEQLLQVNLTGAFFCTRAAVKQMTRKRWGRIVNISSVVGLMGNVGQINYAAAKAGMIAMGLTAAKEYAKRGITVNSIAPGYIQTRMTEQLTEDVKERWHARIPMGSFGTPEDIAATVVFLCSEGAKYITGEVIRVDGGLFIE